MHSTWASPMYTQYNCDRCSRDRTRALRVSSKKTHNGWDSHKTRYILKPVHMRLGNVSCQSYTRMRWEGTTCLLLCAKYFSSLTNKALLLPLYIEDPASLF